MQTRSLTVLVGELVEIPEAIFTSTFGDGRRSFPNKNRYTERKRDGQRDFCTGAAMANQDKTEGRAPTRHRRDRKAQWPDQFLVRIAQTHN